MRLFALLLFAVGILVGQDQPGGAMDLHTGVGEPRAVPCTRAKDIYLDTRNREYYDCSASGFWTLRPSKRVFVDKDATVTVIKDETSGLIEPLLLNTPADIAADTAIIDLFYRYESEFFKGSDGKPVKLLLSVHVNCPVVGSAGVVCDPAPPRVGFSLESIEFVRVRYLRTVKEIDHIKAQQ